MYRNNTPSGLLKLDTYEESRSNIRRLKENLPESQVATLAREVIRRIASRDAALASPAGKPTKSELILFCHALISDSEDAAAEMIFDLRAEGVSAEAVYLKHLAEAARLLGVWWTEDRVDFAQVTVGTSRMFAIMRGMQHLFRPTKYLTNKSAIFAPVPGEDHTMGVRMAADLFRKDGWEIALKIGYGHDDLVTYIEQSPSSILGLSISGRHSIDALSKLVVAIHICCPHVPILVSGQDIEDVTKIVSLMGVDGIATDVDDANAQMSIMLERKSKK